MGLPVSITICTASALNCGLNRRRCSTMNRSSQSRCPVQDPWYTPEFVEVVEAAADPQVGRGVDDGLDPQRAAVLEVLLDPGVFVERVHRDVHPAGDDLGLEHPGGGALGAVADLSAEDDLDGVGAAQVEVVPDQRLEEAAGVPGGVEDQG